MVSELTSTSSGKWNVMNTSPGRRAGSMCTGATTEPRRELIRTSSPATTPSRSASSGHMSTVSPRRSGEAKPDDCTPVLYESSLRPVVSRSGYSSSSRSTGGEWRGVANGAGSPRLAGSVSHSRACR